MSMTARDAIVRNKVVIQDILCEEPQYVLDTVVAKGFITTREQRNLASINQGNVESKVSALVDKIIGKTEDTCKAFVDLLQTADFIKEIPRLEDIQWGSIAGKGTSSKREEAPETVPSTNKAATGSKKVTEKQLRRVANQIGNKWKLIGTHLDVPGVKMEQFEGDNPGNHANQVFRMLEYWSKCQKTKATAANLHATLEELEPDLVPEGIEFLLEEN